MPVGGRRGGLFVVVGVFALFAGSACLSARDNANDPQNRPVAALRVVDTTDSIDPETGIATCFTDFGSGVVYPNFGAASRGRCVTLDARESADPNGDALLYRYVGNGVELALTSAAVLTLTGPQRRALPTGTTVDFSVTVVDPRLAEDTATSDATLLNGRPFVTTAPTTFLPLRGYAWNPDADFQHAFRPAASGDPDGDPLTFIWQFPDASLPLSSTSATDSSFTRSIPSASEQRYLAKLQVSDGDLLSVLAIEAVKVGRGPVWSHFNLGDTVERIDGLDRTLTFLNVAGASGHLSPEVAAVIGGTGDVTRIAAMPRRLNAGVPAVGGATLAMSVRNGNAPVVSSVEWQWLADGPSSVAVAGNGSGRVWVLGAIQGEPGFSITRFADLGETLTEERRTPVQVNQTDVPGLMLAVDADGTAWGAALLDTALHAVPSSGAPSGIFDAERAYSGLARNPGDGHAWALDVSSLTGTEFEEATLLELASTGTVLQRLPLGRPYAFGLAFATRNEAWIGVPGEGLFLVDVDLLAGGASLDVASIEVFPEVATTITFRPVVDPISGDCWTKGTTAIGEPIYWRTGTDGTIATFANEAGTIHFVDDVGLLWYGAAPESMDPDLDLAASATPAVASGAALRRTFPNMQNPAVDPRTGGIWVPTAVPPALTLVGVDGRVHRQVVSVTVNDAGTLAAVPRLSSVRVSPEGRWLWAVESGLNGSTGMARFDLDADPPRREPIPLANPGDVNLIAFTNAVLLPARPLPGQTDFAWIARGTGTTGYVIGVLQHDGTIIDVFTVPEGERFNPPAFASYGPPGAALHPVTNSLFLVTVEQMSGEAVVRQIEPDGKVSPFARFDRSDEFTVCGPFDCAVHAGVAHDAGSPVPWVAYSYPLGSTGNGGRASSLAVFSALGDVQLFQAFPGERIHRVLPIAPEAAWLTLAGDFDAQLSRLSFNPLGLGLIVTEVDLAPRSGDDPPYLVVPNGK